MKNVIIKASGLNIGYSNKKSKKIVCNDGNFEFYTGEMICLLGKNGSGKSTLLKTLANLLPILNGDFKVFGQSQKTLNSKQFAQSIAIVLTESIPENTLTVTETIALGRQPYNDWLGKTNRKDLKIIENAMRLTDVGLLKNKSVHELSDGQLQRVMIARALAQDTPIILLDEPTSYLDIHHKINIFKILHKICNETEKTVVISTHEVNLALKNADRLMLIHDKKITIGKHQEQHIQNKLRDLFNSDEIKYDSNINQYRLKQKKNS